MAFTLYSPGLEGSIRGVMDKAAPSVQKGVCGGGGAQNSRSNKTNKLLPGILQLYK